MACAWVRRRGGRGDQAHTVVAGEGGGRPDLGYIGEGDQEEGVIKSC